MNNKIAKTFQSIRLQSISSKPLPLKVGQMISGKVIKFLPQNKAYIQVGDQHVIAELKNNLLVNERYLFQVKHANPYVHLQVVSNKQLRSEKDSIQILLQKIGLRGNAVRNTFIDTLLQQEVPIKEEQLKQGIKLLEQFPDREKAMQVLVEMLKQNLPITKNIYESLYQKIYEPISLTEKTKVIMNQLNSIGLKSIETYQIRSFLSVIDPTSFKPSLQGITSQLLHEMNNGDNVHFHLLQKTGHLSKETTFESWKNSWTTFITNQNDPIGQITNKNLPFESLEDFYNGMKKLWAEGALLTKHEKQFLTLYMLQSLTHFEGKEQLSLHDQFLIKLQAFFTLTNWENTKSTPALPYLLQTLIQESNSPVIQQESQQLLQFFTSIAISRGEQTDIQFFNFQLPGELFGLKNDIFMNIDGKNDPNGQLSSDFFRIIFYLEMESLKETVIDMKVQKQIITLTIYHDEPEKLRPIMKGIQPTLQKQLEEKNYFVSSVVVLPFKEQNKSYKHQKIEYPSYSKGVDLQI